MCARWARARASGPAPSSARQHPVEVALGVAEPRGQPGHAVALDHAVGDQPHRAGGEVGADVPVGRAGHGVGQAAAAGAEAAQLGRGRRRQELDVGALGRDGRAGRAAVDAGGADGGDELAVEPRVARGHGAVAAFVVENHRTMLPPAGSRSGGNRTRRPERSAAVAQVSSGPNWIAAQPSSRSRRRTRSIMSPWSTAGARRTSGRNAAVRQNPATSRRATTLVPVALTIGIVGLPNVGKSTLFNALTKNDVLAANYPFATIEPNVGVVGVPDPRLGELAEIFGSAKIVPGDGVVRRHRRHRPGASEGEGLGNKFLANIREADAICQVDPGLPRRRRRPRRRRGRPRRRHRDDQHRADPRRPADAREGDPAAGEGGARATRSAPPCSTAARRRRSALEAGTPSSPPTIDRALLRELSLLTAKPFLYVFNCDEDELADEALKQRAARPGRAGRGDLPRRQDRGRAGRARRRRRGPRAARRDRAVDEPGLDALARVGFDTLGLQTYLTAGPKESRAWTIRQGATAPEAAGVIHTDFQRGFIKAEIVSFDDLVAAGSMAAAKAARQGPHGGQGLRHGRRRRRGVPLQRVTGRALRSTFLSRILVMQL